jgi:hypothetical protein
MVSPLNEDHLTMRGQAYIKGIRAAHAGVDELDNPYYQHTEEWYGWRSGHRDQVDWLARQPPPAVNRKQQWEN